MKKLTVLILALIISVTLFGCVEKAPKGKTPEELYATSVEDAKVAEADEIMPLVTLTHDSNMVTWSADGEKVLLLSWHESPDRYRAGESFTCADGEIWVFTDKEICVWYNENSEGVTDWELRLEQLIGLPADTEYTHVSAFWVDMDEVVRPAFQPDVEKQMSEELLDGSALGDMKDWFDGNAEYSYSEDTPYPWTRLGYTYDWADNGREYGLSEFLILADSVIEVEWTKSTAEFIVWMEEN